MHAVERLFHDVALLCFSAVVWSARSGFSSACTLPDAGPRSASLAPPAGRKCSRTHGSHNKSIRPKSHLAQFVQLSNWSLVFMHFSRQLYAIIICIIIMKRVIPAVWYQVPLSARFANNLTVQLQYDTAFVKNDYLLGVVQNCQHLWKRTEGRGGRGGDHRMLFSKINIWR